ncbi:spaetzle-processing enzyme-like [Drosophila ficusphila]|uniref:spaetzle-processing enzyme-like n=1 Tax=Drosophila ficusphila TaxID=30025 RepID=UPI0007E61918|nr:spaetzle-processing enzyme-like [Drosophila ficusphila]
MCALKMFLYFVVLYTFLLANGQQQSDSQSCGRVPLALRDSVGQQMNLFPWMALLTYKNRLTSEPDGNPQSLSAGSLIHKRYVLTAANCVIRRELIQRDIVLKGVRLGEHNISSNPDCITERDRTRCAPPHLEVDVEQIIVHGDYRMDVPYQNDIALLRLDRPVVYTAAIQPICIQGGGDQGNRSNSHLIAGWDLGNERCPGQELLHSHIKKLPSVACSRHPNFDASSKICAGGQDACVVISGGPLMTSIGHGLDEFVYLAGITSYEFKTSSQKVNPVVFTKTEHFLSWIIKYLRP